MREEREVISSAPLPQRLTSNPVFSAAVSSAVLLSALVALIAAFAPATVLIAALGVLLCVLIGMVLALWQRVRSVDAKPRLLQTLLNLARDPDVAELHARISDAMERVAEQTDPIYRRVALERLNAVAEQCSRMGQGLIEFTSTESWRVVYEELLRSPGLHLYRSVAHIESSQYWQDNPGQQSTKLNLELHDAGLVSVERIAIIADHLWPEDSLFPMPAVHAWLEEQHLHGIWLQLVRESALADEPKLIEDFGIYGNRAVGWQQSYLTGKTQRFVLSFDFDRLRKAEEAWKQLSVFSLPYRDLLDRTH
jgi:hypothetical protein